MKDMQVCYVYIAGLYFNSIEEKNHEESNAGIWDKTRSNQNVSFGK